MSEGGLGQVKVTLCCTVVPVLSGLKNLVASFERKTDSTQSSGLVIGI